MAEGRFEFILILGTTVRTLYYTFIYWAIYKEIKKNEETL